MAKFSLVDSSRSKIVKDIWILLPAFRGPFFRRGESLNITNLRAPYDTLH